MSCCTNSFSSTTENSPSCNVAGLAGAETGAIFVGATGTIYIMTGTDPCNNADWESQDLPDCEFFINGVTMNCGSTLTFTSADGSILITTLGNTVNFVANSAANFIFQDEYGANFTANDGDTITLRDANGVVVEVTATGYTISGNSYSGAGAPVLVPTHSTIVNSYFDTTNNQLYEWNPNTNTWQAVGGSFTIQDDSGSTDTISSGNTLSVLGANGVNTDITAVDTITIYGNTTSSAAVPVAAPLDQTQANFHYNTATETLYVWNPVTLAWDTGSDNEVVTYSAATPVAAPADPTITNINVNTTDCTLTIWNPNTLTWCTPTAFVLQDDLAATDAIPMGSTVQVLGVEGVNTEITANNVLTVHGNTTFAAGAPGLFLPYDQTQTNFYYDTNNDVLYSWNPVTLAWEAINPKSLPVANYSYTLGALSGTLDSQSSSSTRNGCTITRAWTGAGITFSSTTAINPTFTVAAPGTYTATLTVTDCDGFTSVFEETFCVPRYDPCQSLIDLTAADFADPDVPTDAEVLAVQTTDNYADGTVLRYIRNAEEYLWIVKCTS